MKKGLVLLLAAAILCLGLSAFAQGNVMKFDKTASFVFEGETLQTVLTREGDPAGGSLTYASSNEKLATVDENGLVTGLSKGKVTITATVQTETKKYRTQLSVTVGRKAASVALNTSKLTVFDASDSRVAALLAAAAPEDSALPVLVLPVGKRVSLQADVLPKDAASRRVTVSSSDESVLSVKGAAVTAESAGEAVLTVASDLSPEVNARYRVLAVKPVTRLVPVAPAKSVAAGEQITLSTEAYPADATIQAVRWTSSSDEIATVDENGVVTGHKRGTVRLVATVADGSGTRASLSLKVTQKAEQITLNQTALRVAVGRTAVLKPTVLPRSADDKTVIWSSSDESVATVNSRGRVTAVALGSCEITCASATSGEVKATAAVEVFQPVTKIAFAGTLELYVGETGRLAWTVEPADATDPGVHLTSSNTKILTVDDHGTVTPVKAGQTWVTATANDGSGRKARVKVTVLQHVLGVHMLRKTAYVDLGETVSAGAVLEPENASNRHMSWESADPSIARASGKANRVSISGRRKGETVVTGTTEDGGFRTSIAVKVGEWYKSLKLTEATVNGKGDLEIEVRNVSDLRITAVTAQITFFDRNGNPLNVNLKDGTNVIEARYRRTLEHNDRTSMNHWVLKDYEKPENDPIGSYEIRIISFQIDGDWVKTIRENRQPVLEYHFGKN